MSIAQARRAFEAQFSLSAPQALDRLDRLTPGDFAVAARKAAVLGTSDASGLLVLLRAEIAVKPGTRGDRIGFLP